MSIVRTPCATFEPKGAVMNPHTIDPNKIGTLFIVGIFLIGVLSVVLYVLFDSLKRLERRVDVSEANDLLAQIEASVLRYRIIHNRWPENIEACGKRSDGYQDLNLRTTGSAVVVTVTVFHTGICLTRVIDIE